MALLLSSLIMLATLSTAAATADFESPGSFGPTNFLFSASTTPWYAESNAVGVAGSRALALISGGGTDVSATYHPVSFDLSAFNSMAEVCIFFRKDPAITNVSSRVLDIGILPASNSFLNGSVLGGVRLRSTGTDTCTLRLWNNGSEFGAAPGASLAGGHFYKLTCRLTNLDGVQLQFIATVDDYGTDGTTLLSAGILSVTGTNNNPTLATDGTVFGGFRMRNENNSRAIGVLDDFIVTGQAGAGLRPPRVFVHPGLLNTSGEMDLWAALSAQAGSAAADGLARVQGGRDDAGTNFLHHVAHPVAQYGAFPHWSAPGPARQLIDDARAAYANALLWRATGQVMNAAKAAEIIDAWSSTLQTILNVNSEPFSPADGRQDYMLYTSYSWPAMIWAAEILRSLPGSGWGESGQVAFSNLLVNIVRPAAEHPNNNLANNWASWRICCKMSTAIYLDDTARFHEALEDFKALINSYIGENLYGEMTRDLWHSQMGIVPLLLTAEMALKQGVDLYSFGNDRLLRCVEFQIPFYLGQYANWPAGTTPDPGVQWDGSMLWNMFELPYHHYHRRLGSPTPQLETILAADNVKPIPSLPVPSVAPNQPRPYRAEDFYRTGYHTLTHTTDPFRYVLVAGFDWQSPLPVFTNAACALVADPTPGQANNGVLRLNSNGQLTRSIPVTGTLHLSFDYRFGQQGNLVIALDDTPLATVAGVASNYFAQYRATFAGLSPGNHTLTLTSSSQMWLDNLIVTTPNVTSYAVWAVAHGVNLDPHADSDGDGIKNLLEYALGLDPIVASVGGLPVLGFEGDRLTMTYARRKQPTDVTYEVQITSDLTAPWETTSLSDQELDDDGLFQLIKVTDATTNAPQRFIRLKVSLP